MPELSPAECLVQPLSGGASTFWTGPPRPRQRRPRQRADAGSQLHGVGEELQEASAEEPMQSPEREAWPAGASSEDDDSIVDEAEAGEGVLETADAEIDLEEMVTTLLEQQTPVAAQGQSAGAGVLQGEEGGDLLEMQSLLPPEAREEAAAAFAVEADEEAAAEDPVPGTPPGEAAAPAEAVVPRDDAPPPAMAAPGRRNPLFRLPNELELHVAGGKVTYYSRGFFTATCSNPLHGKCVLSRSAEAGRKSSQGRPLSFLVCWLSQGPGHLTKADHWDKTRWPSLLPKSLESCSFWMGWFCMATLDHC